VFFVFFYLLPKIMATPNISVFVTGATGNTGGATIRCLAKAKNVTIHAGVRDEKSAAEKFKDCPGIIFHKGDGDVAALAGEMKGCDVVVVTPPGDNRVNISIGYIEAAKKAGVKFLSLLSVACVGMDDILFGHQFSIIEWFMKKSGIPYCSLRCTMFMENQYGNIGSVKGGSAFYYPVNGDMPFSHVAVSDIGACQAKIVQEYSKHKNTTYVLSGEFLTMNELAAVYTKVLGKDVKFYQATEEQAITAMTAMFPEWQARGIVELWNMVDKGTCSRRCDVERILGHGTRTSTHKFLTGIAACFK